MVKASRYPRHAIVTLEIERWQPFPFGRFPLQLRGAYLRLQTLVILPAAVGDFLGFIDIHRCQIGVGRCIGELDFLFRRKANLSIERDLCLLEVHLSRDNSLLLGLELYSGSQFIQICCRTRLVLGYGLVQQHLVSLQQSPRIVHLCP